MIVKYKKFFLSFGVRVWLIVSPTLGLHEMISVPAAISPLPFSLQIDRFRAATGGTLAG